MARSIRLLIMDHDPEHADMLAFRLERLGYETLKCQHVTEGCKIMSEQRIDGVVVHAATPELTGDSLVKSWKNFAPEIPAIFLMDYIENDLFCLAGGTHLLLEKPVNFRAVDSFFQHLLSDEPGGRAERFLAKSKVLVALPETDTIVPAELRDISAGGVFVKLDKNFPACGDLITFRILFGQEIIEGQGICRWVRTKKQGDLPSGVGIEFCELSPRSHNCVSEMLNELRSEQ